MFLSTKDANTQPFVNNIEKKSLLQMINVGQINKDYNIPINMIFSPSYTKSESY